MPLYIVNVPYVGFIVQADTPDDAADQVRDTLLEVASSWDDIQVRD